MEGKRAYTSDLTDKQWRIPGPHIPAELPGGRHREHPMRSIVNAILYRLKNGCCWEDLPHDFPPHQTVYEYYRNWTLDGTWEGIHGILRDRLRLKRGRLTQPSAGIIDSQSVKTAEKGGFAAMIYPKGIHIRTAPTSPTAADGARRQKAENATFWSIRWG